jgi:2'-5' RNA ligase
MRLFTGIAIPQDACALLTDLAHRLCPQLNLAWTPEAKLHITTKFIGEWPDSCLPELQHTLAGIVLTEPVEIHIRGLLRMSGALCAGVQMSADLHRMTDGALASLGIAKETRPFRPHVTLGRARRVSFSVPHTDLDIAPFRANCFHLYLSANGTYTKLSDYALPK